MQAFTNGKLRIEGDVMKSQLLGKLFAPQPAEPTSPPPSKPVSGGASGVSGEVEQIFNAMPKNFKAAEAQGVDVVFQYKIAGGGDWSVVIKNQQCQVRKEVIANAHCTLTIDAENFLKLRKGELDPMQAFTSGKLTIQGDMMKSQLLSKLFS